MCLATAGGKGMSQEVALEAGQSHTLIRRKEGFLLPSPPPPSLLMVHYLFGEPSPLCEGGVII